MITSTFYALTNQGRAIQKLVGRYDGRFACNPRVTWLGQSQFVITFDDGDKYRQFNTCLQIINQPWY